ncbi:hypothetical protein MAM1_0268d08972 [Mucor ambiguus]|uniref:Alkyl hydroperoxide reductase subunit C/ Thiol specific antioxidant domain-containing protein n=1 Tax=Mucor ambiguus TaxID=91626 RepID=A0A0C9LX07_9FUNG|nr:hypothetical protein MAM1_0268d08972 [Mucor ambiguus]
MQRLKTNTPSKKLKRFRDLRDDVETDLSEHISSKLKITHPNRPALYDFQCVIFYQGQVLQFQLSDVFSGGNYAVVFFCGYDFTEQSRSDLMQIEKHYHEFVKLGAIPIVMTHDRAEIHAVYATPNATPASLDFLPSFIMASDTPDRSVSQTIKSATDKSEMQRSVIIMDSNINLLFIQRVPGNASFPMEYLLNGLPQQQQQHGL